MCPLCGQEPAAEKHCDGRRHADVERLRKIAANDFKELGDASTLADPGERSKAF